MLSRVIPAADGLDDLHGCQVGLGRRQAVKAPFKIKPGAVLLHERSGLRLVRRAGSEDGVDRGNGRKATLELFHGTFLTTIADNP
jgi:hypothetical protein